MSEYIIRTTNMPEHVMEALSVWCETNEEIVRCKCSECGYATPDGSNYCQNCGRKVVE